MVVRMRLYIPGWCNVRGLHAGRIHEDDDRHAKGRRKLLPCSPYPCINRTALADASGKDGVGYDVRNVCIKTEPRTIQYIHPFQVLSCLFSFPNPYSPSSD